MQLTSQFAIFIGRSESAHPREAAAMTAFGSRE